MTLEGWSLPLSPGGTAALVPPPPWHFSGEALGIDFHCDPAGRGGGPARPSRAHRRRIGLLPLL